MFKLSTGRVLSWLASLLLLTLTTSLHAQVTTRQVSGNAGLNQFGAFGIQGGTIPQLEMAQLDLVRLRAEDLQYQKNGRPLRVAVQQNASVDIPGAGAVVDRNGYRIYQYEVVAPGAAALSALFDRLQLAEGARLFLYDAARTVLVGPITDRQNSTTSTFTSGHVPGDRIIIELQEPIGVAGQSQLHLSGVANFYEPRGPFGGLRPAGACNNNQACFPAYQSEAEGVALILVNDGAGGLFLCTGATVNDAQQSFRSFFLTAFHCIDFDADQVNDPNEASSTASWTFYFKYQSATCTPTADDDVYVTLNGATYRSGSAASDFTLLELNAQAPQSENISFLGWDRSSALASTVFGIHHPNGSLKKISFGGATSTVGVSYGSDGSYNVVSGTSFLQLRWNNGVTEGGSSGSPLFNGTSRRIIGQLLGGSSFCTPASAKTAPDQYGRFFTSWTGGGSNVTRLSNWLDPTNISSTTTDLAVPTVSGPVAFTNTGTFALNTGVSATTSWSIVGINGLAFSQSSGSGNVASLTAIANASNVVIRFTVSAGQSYAIQFTKTFNVSVATPGNTAPTVANPVSPQSATVGTAYTLSLANVFTDAETPGQLTLSVSGLPAGLSFTPPSTISGTPSMSGVASVIVTATDPGSLSASTTFSITVSPAPVVVASLSITASANPTMILTTGTTTLSATVSGGTAPYTYSFSGPGTITPSGNTASVSGLSVGVQTFTVVATDASTPAGQTISATVSVTVTAVPPVNQAPVVANAIPPQSATVGQGFSYVIPANTFSDPNNDALTLSVSGLPAGLNFSAPATISGTPSMSGTSTVTVTATDPGSLAVSTTFTITVSPATSMTSTGPFAITSVTTVSCTPVANRINLTFNPQYAGLDGSPVSFSVANELAATTAAGPYTLSLYADNPVISLRAVQNGVLSSFSYSWLAACNSMTVAPGNTAPTVANAISPQSATVGQGFSYVIPASTFTDAQTPNALALSVSGLPAGLNFTAPATISGVPSSAGSSNVTVTATDPGGLSVSTLFAITVSPAGSMTSAAPFSITGVTTLDCTPVANRINVSFNPQYAGLDGSPVSFSVANELAATTAAGPYTLSLYADNPVISLRAVQNGVLSSFSYSWLAACNSMTVAPGNTAPTVANAIPPQSATVGQGFSYVIPASTFTDAQTPNALALSVSGLPAGLNFTAPATISGTPSMAGSSNVTVTATDPGGLSVSTLFAITVSPAGSMTSAAPFSITGVTTVSCSTITAGLLSVTFNPRYAGLDGSPVSFSVANELAATTAAGPYTLSLYTDNPVISLRAVQSGVTTGFAYNWLVACGSGNGRIASTELTAKLNATIYPNPVSDVFTVRIEGAQGKSVQLLLTDVSGHALTTKSVVIDTADHQEPVQIGARQPGLYLLRVSTGKEAITLKVIKH